MTEIMPHSENIVNLFYWMTLSDVFFAVSVGSSALTLSPSP